MAISTASDFREQDEIIIRTLEDKNRENNTVVSQKTGIRFMNDQLAEFADTVYSKEALHKLEDLLTSKGAIDIPILRGYTIAVDGEEQPVAIVAATDLGGNHGDMSSMLYLRDHIQVASGFMELYLHNSAIYAKEGKLAHELFLSALHLMSTKSQLARFNDVIVRGGAAGQEDWPHISLFFNDLEAKNTNGWRNKQDTFQMLAYLACDALLRGFLKEDELLNAHKTFLGSVVPLLSSVGFPLYENSGSWEEFAANRTSVMAVETATLYKMRLLRKQNRLDFLAAQQDTLDELYIAGLRQLGRRLPDESPEYAIKDIKYRDADAALVYVLLYDIPKQLVEAHILVGQDNPRVLTQIGIENLVLAHLKQLDDPLTGGMIRYKNDSYQRVNFHTNAIQAVVRTMKRQVRNEAEKRGGEIDLALKQRLRGEMMPKGREAVWTHPLGQLASWAAKRSNETTDTEMNRYRALSIGFLNRMLGLVTGMYQWHAVLDESGAYIVTKVIPFRLPECYITYRSVSGEELVIPSPHTPLNWSSAMLRQAVGLLQDH